MTKKEYIDSHSMDAVHSVSAWLAYGFHGIDYGVDDYAYISTIVNGEIESYHRAKIKYERGTQRHYMMVNGVKLYTDDFWKW